MFGRTLKPVFIRMTFIVAIVLCWSVATFTDFVKDAQADDLSLDLSVVDSRLTEWLTLADQGDPVAQFNLGNMYENGEGVPKNRPLAAKWYRKAAEQGHAKAQYYLAHMYAYGQSEYNKGVPLDYAEAIKWWLKAAEQGHAKAQYILGLMYDNGSQGVLQDYVEAVKWWRKAAQQGDVSAQNKMGDMYYNGEGVPRDYVLAHMWYNLGASQGDETAKKNRKKISEEMSPSQILKAQKKAKRCLTSTYQNC